MESVIERYNKLTEDRHQAVDPILDVKFWQREAASLRQQLQQLNDSQRQLMGQELSSLDFDELRHLEHQLEMSLKSIRMRKGQIFSDEINELHKKRSLSSKENEEIHKKIEQIGEENAELEK
ncbi:hypothetical protein TSUD_84660, partial [Trifolium subterraneum]